MRCLIVLSVATAAVLAYGRQSSGYETAELYQPAPAVPLSADGGNQQAYNSDGATAVVSSPPPTPPLLPLSSVAPATGTLVTTGPALVPVAGAIPVGTNGRLTGVTPGAAAIGTSGGLSGVSIPVATNGGLSAINSGVPVAASGGLSGVNIPVATGGVLNSVNIPLATNGGLNRAASRATVTVGKGYGLRRRLFRHRVRRVRL